MKRLQLLLLWVWMVCFSAASHDYMFKHLEVKDGLSNNQVNAISIKKLGKGVKLFEIKTDSDLYTQKVIIK